MRSGADSMGHGRARAPHFYKWLGTGGTVSRRTASKKLTKLYWPSRKRSPKRLIIILEPKSGGARQKISVALGAPTFTPGRWPPLSNSCATVYAYVKVMMILCNCTSQLKLKLHAVLFIHCVFTIYTQSRLIVNQSISHALVWLLLYVQHSD